VVRFEVEDEEFGAWGSGGFVDVGECFSLYRDEEHIGVELWDRWVRVVGEDEFIGGLVEVVSEGVVDVFGGVVVVFFFNVRWVCVEHDIWVIFDFFKDVGEVFVEDLDGFKSFVCFDEFLDFILEDYGFVILYRVSE